MKKSSLIWFIVIGIILILTIVFWLIRPYLLSDWEYPVYGHMIGGWAMPFGMIGMGLFWAFIIYLVFRATNQHEMHRHDSALETLKGRLARGEISIEEYEKLVSKINEEK